MKKMKQKSSKAKQTTNMFLWVVLVAYLALVGLIFLRSAQPNQNMNKKAGEMIEEKMNEKPVDKSNKTGGSIKY